MTGKKKEIHQKKRRKKKIPGGVLVIAIWLVASTIPVMYESMNLDLEMFLSPLVTIDWAYIICAIICSAGLFSLQEWARRWVILIFVIYLGWIASVFHYLNEPSFNMFVSLKFSEFFKTTNIAVPAIIIKIVIFLGMIVYFLWPIIVIFYLSYPKVKKSFDFTVKN